MIWLIGSKGMLASEVAAQLNQYSIQWIGSDKEVDITDRTSVETFAQRNFVTGALQWIINCAAYTAVDNAEDDPETAQKLNADALINICEVAKQYGAQLIHFSTDYVFDGASAVPYIETDVTNPQSVYGRTKLQGEQNIIGLLPEHYIIRTAWLYGKNGINFVSTMLRLMNEKGSLKVVNDQRGSPTYAVDLAKTVLQIIQQNNHRYDIYHYSNEGNITWYDFACEIYRQGKEMGLLKRTCSVVPCTSSEFPQKAHRPSFSLLNKQKIKEVFSLSVPNWNESLSLYLKELL
ncbi:dTDP-4-dehydrorhamnose reductase [Treponema vincentii]|uniref:dTDP-4-dehydrorhamnose reductase n=1 Tax=Treponema vincentii TaxID=69710 RepID=UPI001BB089C7|nr:dTDP-4-dehydrorhamnose reductase [Treponema vincentii]QUY18755.1 dTDP-4-dehydrorhamnose reductase [Treponema vincentii]